MSPVGEVAESELRIPSFNDFSPGTLKRDIRPVLAAINRHSGNDAAIFLDWEQDWATGWDAKRVRTNIPATLGSTGLTSGRPMELTTFGRAVLAAASAKEASQVFCAEIIQNRNGLKVVEAIGNLHRRGDKATKISLQAELERLGVKLSNDTTDHTTLKNWMIEAGIVTESKANFPEIDDVVLKKLTGVSASEHDELQSLKQGQRLFLELLRKLHVTADGPFDVHALYTECRGTHPHAFGSANLANAILEPLSRGGWIEVSAPRGGGRGGKSGWVSGTNKLLDIPTDRVIPNFSSSVPPDLHSKLHTPLAQIKEWLDGTDTHKGGLGLKLLALRIILDLRLIPRDFRQRGRDTAYAEVDVTAEGSHLLFSRWTFQCKRIQSNKNVGLGDVAKEVGIAIYMKAHVIVMVSTGGFSADALAYAREITNATHLQFVFLDKKIVQNYLRVGADELHRFVVRNASLVMTQKQTQQISPVGAK